MHINSLSLYILTMVTAWSMSISGPGPGTSITLLGALLDCPPTFIFCWKYNDHTIWGLPSSEVESKYKKIPYIFIMVTFYWKVKIYILMNTSSWKIFNNLNMYKEKQLNILSVVNMVYMYMYLGSNSIFITNITIYSCRKYYMYKSIWIFIPNNCYSSPVSLSLNSFVTTNCRLSSGDWLSLFASFVKWTTSVTNKK